MPQVSIIIPAYNVENYIEKALYSIERQSFTDFEVIIVNDGSTDETASLLDEYQAKNNHVHVIHQQNQGVSAARNAGLKNAVGEFILFMDPDDTLSPQHVSSLIKVAVDNQSDITRSSSYKLVYEETGKETLIEENLSELSKEDYIQRMFWSKSFQERNRIGSAVWLALFKRSLLEKHAIWFDPELKFGEDTLFHMKAAYFANNISYSETATYYYLVNANSATQKYNSTYFEKHQLALVKQVEFLAKINFPNYKSLSDVALIDITLKAIKHEKIASIPQRELSRKLNRLLENNMIMNATNRLLRSSIPMSYRIKLLLIKMKQPTILYKLL